MKRNENSRPIAGISKLPNPVEELRKYDRLKTKSSPHAPTHQSDGNRIGHPALSVGCDKSLQETFGSVRMTSTTSAGRSLPAFHPQFV